MPTIEIRVEGKVQGVYYRAVARERAKELDITGWVKNTADGAVLIRATGSGRALRQFVKWCGEGPPDAVVEQVIETDVADESFPDFQIIRGRG